MVSIKNSENNEPENNSVAEIRSFSNVLAPGENFNEMVEAWIAGDTNNLGYEHLNDEQLINIVNNPVC